MWRNVSWVRYAVSREIHQINSIVNTCRTQRLGSSSVEDLRHWQVFGIKSGTPTVACLPTTLHEGYTYDRQRPETNVYLMLNQIFTNSLNPPGLKQRTTTASYAPTSLYNSSWWHRFSAVSWRAGIVFTRHRPYRIDNVLCLSVVSVTWNLPRPHQRVLWSTVTDSRADRNLNDS